MQNEKIDLILPWVNGNDPAWLKEKETYSKKYNLLAEENTEIRFQSWDNLQYIFRGIEKYMPWINKVFFVTWGHLPEWMNTSYDRLVIIRHEDYIPSEYLPTFNSNVIEMNYFRIQELCENFILFNDDLFPISPIPETYYFQNNLPCEEAVETHMTLNGKMTDWLLYSFINNMLIINRHFDKRKVVRENWNKWFHPIYGKRIRQNLSLRYWRNFESFVYPHEAKPMKKSTIREIWEKEPDILDRASRNKFRSYSDITQNLVSIWQICSGKFIPHRYKGKFFLVDIDNCKEIADVIRHHKYPIISLNEQETNDFETVKSVIAEALQEILPEKSRFEL